MPSIRFTISVKMHLFQRINAFRFGSNWIHFGVLISKKNNEKFGILACHKDEQINAQ